MGEITKNKFEGKKEAKGNFGPLGVEVFTYHAEACFLLSHSADIKVLISPAVEKRVSCKSFIS